MRVAVMGTSNSVMRNGYCAILNELGAAEVANFSLGGASNVLLPYRVPALDCEWYDTVLIDTMVNDLFLTADDFICLQRTRQVMAETVAYLVSRGLRVVLLLLPVNNASVDHAGLRRDYIGIAAHYGAVVVDGYELAQALLEHGVPASLVFQDPAHLNPAPAMMVAQRVADALQALPDRPWSGRGDPSDYPYSVHTPAGASWPTVARGTSLVQGCYVQVSAGQSVSFRFDEPREVLALSINAAKTSAIVEIRGHAASVFKDLRVAGASEPKLRQSLVPLLCLPAGPEITIRVLEETDIAGAAPERTIHTFGGVARGMLEIDGIITRRQGAPSPGLPPPAAALRPVPKLNRWERGVAALMWRQPPMPPAEAILRHQFDALFGGKRDFSGYESADLLREIGRLAIAAGDRVAARSALRQALLQRPGGTIIRDLLAGLG